MESIPPCCLSRRKVVSWLITQSPPHSQQLVNLQAVIPWLDAMKHAKAGNVKNKTAKNMEMSQRILQGDEMMGVVHKHMDEALHIIEEHPQGRNVSVEDANHVMEACMLAMSFGYMPSPRPGQILQLTHQGTPNVSPLRSATAFHHSMQAGICLGFIWQVMLRFMHSLGYSFQHSTLKQCCHRRATVET